MSKKHKTKPMQHDLRILKAREWIQTYTGTHLVHGYRKQFKVDHTCALMDLREIGAIDEPRYSQMMAAERERKSTLKRKKAKWQDIDREDLFPDSDDQFFFIAGYTSGGVPYGVTWEDVGSDAHKDPDGDEEFNIF